MSEVSKDTEECIKGNAVYYKIKIDEMIEFEIDNNKVDEGLYRGFENSISEGISEFTERMLEGKDFLSSFTKLNDKAIASSVKVEESSSKMRPYFKNWVFLKLYTMGTNVKDGILLEEQNKELEKENARLKEENKELEEARQGNLIDENSQEGRKPDLIDNMFDYFFNGGKSSSTITKKETKKEVKKDLKEKSEHKVKEN